MNRELLLTHFDRISDAPDAIPRMRQFILDLAVRGKLVEQDPSDEVPSQLLERLGGGTRQTYEDLPSRWVQAKVGRLLDFQYGKGLPNNARLESGRVRVFGSNGVVGYCEKALSENPAIIIGRKGSAGALNICEGPSWTTDVAYFVVPPPFLTIQFLFIALQTLNLDSLGKGVKPGLSRRDAYQMTLNVPPLSEQNRIVAKVSELMVLCDRLETSQAEQESRRDRLASSSLHHLNNGASAEDLRQHSRFYLEHLSRLTIFPAQVKQLRHTILNLAIRGRLVSSFCPPGHIASRTKEGRLFASFDVKAFSGDFASLTLPSHWSVESLAKIASEIVDCPHSTPKWTTEGRICVRTNQFRPGYLDLSDVRYVSESTYAERVLRLTPQENDILYSREGGILGVACRVPPKTQLCLGQRMMLIRPGPAIDAMFLETVLNSPLITRIALEETTGGAAPRVNVATVRAYPIPRPPLPEQRAIVLKVEELMTLCDRLERQLVTTETENRRLLEAVLYNALVPTAAEAA